MVYGSWENFSLRSKERMVADLFSARRSTEIFLLRPSFWLPVYSVSEPCEFATVYPAPEFYHLITSCTSRVYESENMPLQKVSRDTGQGEDYTG